MSTLWTREAPRRSASTTRSAEPAPSGAMKTAGGLAGWVDDRTGGAKLHVGYLLKKSFPDHWSFMLGEIAMYSLIICLLTGTFLTFWFVPSAGQVVYDGSYVPLQGVTMSEAYRSTLDISFDIRGGLLIRQIHHWAALMFIVAITVHMFRVFFTGAFRKPREINWVIGTILSMLALIEGFAGYSLPDDLLSGTGLRAAEGFMQSIPVIGSYLAFVVFGGPFPGEMIIPRLYSRAHPAAPGHHRRAVHRPHRAGLRAEAHPVPRAGPDQQNVVGYPLMPVYIAKAGGFFFIVFGDHRADLRAGARSTRSGRTAPTTRPRSPRAPNRTGTWASPTARCGCCPAGSSSSCSAARCQLQHRPGRHRAAAPCCYTLLGIYPFLEKLGHRRQPRAPPARPAAQRPDPHRHRRHGAHRPT